MLTTHSDEVRSVVSAGVPWVTSRDIPDPAGWADFRFGSAQLADLISVRIADGMKPARVQLLPFPKGLAEGDRIWSMVNPVDEVVFRLLGGRLIEFADAALGPEVVSYRALTIGAGWRTKDFRYGGRLRRSAFAGAHADRAFVGVGTLDVRNYYPSLRFGVIDDVLRETGVSHGVLETLRGMLTGWECVWDVAGLPIGPETSGLLGNVGLVSVDEVIRPLVSSFYRMTDDYAIVCSSREFPEVAARAAEAAGAIGLELNPAKVNHYASRNELPSNLFDPTIDALIRLLAVDRGKGIAEARRVFRAEVESGAPSASRIRFCLGVLASERDHLPRDMIVERPELMRLSPKGFGGYLRSMTKVRAVDPEWLLSRAMATPSAHLAAVQYHLLLACSDLRLSKSLARGLEEFALAPGKWTPLRCAAAEAWASSERGRDVPAVQAALDVGDPSQKRAIVLSLRHVNPSRRRDKLLSRVESSAGELAPSVAWIRAGAPRAA